MMKKPKKMMRGGAAKKMMRGGAAKAPKKKPTVIEKAKMRGLDRPVAKSRGGFAAMRKGGKVKK